MIVHAKMTLSTIHNIFNEHNYHHTILPLFALSMRCGHFILVKLNGYLMPCLANIDTVTLKTQI